MYVFIVNPAAGNGKGVKVVKQFLEEYDHLKNQCKTFYTEYEGHATELTSQIASIYHERIKLLFIVGGDGTFYEAINGLKNKSEIPLSFVPVGSGNDFARGCNNTLNPKKHIIESIKYTKLKPYWFGSFRKDHHNINNLTYFASSLGFGFDAEVAKRVNHSKFKRILNKIRLTSIIYIIGLIVTIFMFKPKNIQLKIDGEQREIQNIWMLTINNHPYFGGGMKIAPNARINQDYFTVTIVHNIAKWKILFLFITVFFGKHTKLKEVESFTSSVIDIQSKHMLTFHADGATGECRRCLVQKDSSVRHVVRK